MCVHSCGSCVGCAQADHRSATFMDIMKLRLLYLAEVRLTSVASVASVASASSWSSWSSDSPAAAQVLLRGYNALLTDADAVFLAPPFDVFPPDAQLVTVTVTDSNRQ